MLKTVSTSAITGSLSYQGTWNANTNMPVLTSSVGTQNWYYVVSTAGNTTLNGVSNWNVGDWAIFNGSVWEKIDGSNLGTMAYQNANAVTITGGTINTVTETNGVYANANITSVAKTFPNTYLANSTATLGNATITLGSTTTSVGNVILTNVTISSGNVSANVSGSTGIPVANAIGTLVVSNGGTGITTLTSSYVPYGNGTSALNSSSSFKFDGTNIVLGASGTNGIQFGSSTVLSDYEEGTWTPTFTNITGSPTGIARYRKIGKQVTLTFEQTGGTFTCTGGSGYITGIPFAGIGGSGVVSACGSISNTAVTSVLALYNASTTGSMYVTESFISAGGVGFTITYFV